MPPRNDIESLLSINDGDTGQPRIFFSMPINEEKKEGDGGKETKLNGRNVFV